MRVFDAVGFGALNVDKLFKVNRIAIAEQESCVTGYVEACGGSAANTMVGLARLGRKVGFVGKVASDNEGRRLLEDFNKENVDTNGTAIAEHGRSGTVMGFIDKEGQRALYVDPGVNDTIVLDETAKEYVSKVRFLHLTSFVGDKPFRAQEQLIRVLPESVRLSIDPGALYARKGYTKLAAMMNKAFVLIPNRGELQLLTGKNDYRRGARALLERGTQVVAVKLGCKGCYVTDGKKNHLVPAFKVKVVDTTGAGDAFCAGFLHGLISGLSLDDCGRVGNFVASRCITEIGARAGLPTAKDLEENNLM
jgi:ribokinase